jgi:beta-lactamase regulating signal transducer with metallopeptidase domain
MMLQIIVYTVAVATALSVVGLCLERLAGLQGQPRRAAWIAAMLLSVLLPAAMISFAPSAAVEAIAVPVAESQATPTPAQATLAAAQSTPATGAPPQAAWKLPRPSDRQLIAAWITASSTLALCLLGASLMLRRRSAGWQRATMRGQDILISEVTGPALVGVLRPRIVVPRWLLQQPVATQALILEHEQQHMAARDPLLIAAGMVLIAAVPWNLPLWWQWRRMRQAIELDCDARVLHAGAEANAYAQVLLAVTQRTTRMPAGALAMSEPVHALERRIDCLVPDAIRYTRSQTIAVLLLAAAGAGAALALEAPALPDRPSRIAPMTAPRDVTPTLPRPSQPAVLAAAAAAPQSVVVAAAQAPRTSESVPAAQPQLPLAPAQAQQPDNAPARESAPFQVIQIKYAKVSDLVAIIKSAPGIGLLSDRGSIAVDERTNTLIVQDTANSVSAIRQLVARLDVPLETVRVEAVVAMVDIDLARELTGVDSPTGFGSTVLGPNQALFTSLKAGQQASRAEIISAPVLVVANRKRAYIEQGAMPLPREAAPGTPTKDHQLRLAFTPTLTPDGRVTLDIDITVDTLVPLRGIAGTPGNAPVPAINTRQVKTQIVLDSGATVLLNVADGPGRQMVVFVTPKWMADQPPNPR